MRPQKHYESDENSFPADAYSVDGFKGIAWHVKATADIGAFNET